ncbi:MAG: site-specific integrase [bacterium]|nr:site-specific integrase [bacterium]
MSIRKRYSKRLGKTVYSVDYYDINHQRRVETVGTVKEEAKRVWEARLGDKARGKNPDIPWSRRVTFGDFSKEYMEYSKENKKAWDRDITSLRHLVPFFGEKRLDQVSSFDVEQYKLERKKETSRIKKSPSPASINRELALLKNMFNKAILWGKAKSNPMKGIKLFKESEGRINYLQENEIQKLLKACSRNTNLHLIVLMALNTGMRRGEILKLKWEQIDWKEKIIHLYETKNGRTRHIPISDSLTEELKDFRLNNEGGEFVFSNCQGEPFKSFRKSFGNACREAGIHDFRFHDLRHTFASYLVMGGTDLVTVMELLGHRSFKMTLRYSHLSQDHKRDAVNYIGTILTGDSGRDGNKLVKIQERREKVASLSN